MAKSIEELKELTGECNKLAGKLKELSEEELEHVIGGANVTPQLAQIIGGIFIATPVFGAAKELRVGQAEKLKIRQGETVGIVGTGEKNDDFIG